MYSLTILTFIALFSLLSVLILNETNHQIKQLPSKIVKTMITFILKPIQNEINELKKEIEAIKSKIKE